MEAIAYARKHFKKFVTKFTTEIQSLMGALAFVNNGLENSPYRGLCGPTLTVEVSYNAYFANAFNVLIDYELMQMSLLQAADTFLKDACNIMGITKDSPLTVVINTGCTALPALLNLKQVMMSRQVLGIWNGRDELPVRFLHFDCAIYKKF